MSRDPNEVAQELMKNEKFLSIFQRALATGKGINGEDAENLMKDIPKEGDPKRDAWLRKLQKTLREEAMKEAKEELEKVHSDENGQWMYILPEPGFCIKCVTSGGCKIFINICKHERIAEPIPIPKEECDSSDDNEVHFRIPLSCGQARPDTDKSGKPCKVYDVIVNPTTIKRCGEEHEFRRFVAALCMQWIKQKSEPLMNAEEFRNLNFTAKGTLEPQRIRLSSVPMQKNALNDEINLPSTGKGPTAPTHAGGLGNTHKLIEEIDQPAKTPPPPSAPTPEIRRVQPEGVYDWSTHTRPMQSPFFRDSVPAFYDVELFLPGVQSIQEVCVKVSARRLECFREGEDDEQEGKEPFLTVVFDYPVHEDPSEAKFLRKRGLLKMRFAVAIPNETTTTRTAADRDVEEIEQEEARRAEEEREAAWKIHRDRAAQHRAEEEKVFATRRQYVEGLAAVQAGEVPPAIRAEIEGMPKEQLPGLLARLEGRIRRGDAVDELLEKLAEPVLDGLTAFIREKLSLQPKDTTKMGKRVHFDEKTTTTTTTSAAPAKGGVGEAGKGDAAPSTAKNTENSDPRSEALAEYNNATRSEKLFGVPFHNRYLFALD
ncbi:unnamed protein product [Phytomonas sp. EM1]|nr:unnamed protein product [Phytomonas sp. EM1]|eukprot:CCW61377.1 unnamed protein product [Phytomonas sp. isolate EM1]